MTTLGGQFIVDALQLRAIAQKFYPPTWTASARQARRLQRKWLHAWRRAPGVRVAIGPRPSVHVLGNVEPANQPTPEQIQSQRARLQMVAAVVDWHRRDEAGGNR